jgi:hypothetical protein
MKVQLLILSMFLPGLLGCGNKSQSPQSEDTLVAIIFETDRGNDVDDALAPDILYRQKLSGYI